MDVHPFTPAPRSKGKKSSPLVLIRPSVRVCRYMSWFDYPSQAAMVSDDRHKALLHVKYGTLIVSRKVESIAL